MKSPLDKYQWYPNPMLSSPFSDRFSTSPIPKVLSDYSEKHVKLGLKMQPLIFEDDFLEEES